jgi:hypothetical protein
MVRSDLLISLVKAGSSGDAARVRSVAEAIVAEERAKRTTCWRIDRPTRCA